MSAEEDSDTAGALDKDYYAVEHRECLESTTGVGVDCRSSQDDCCGAMGLVCNGNEYSKYAHECVSGRMPEGAPCLSLSFSLLRIYIV